MTYEELLTQADDNGLIVKEKYLLANTGRIKGNRIAIHQDMTQEPVIESSEEQEPDLEL